MIAPTYWRDHNLKMVHRSIFVDQPAPARQGNAFVLAAINHQIGGPCANDISTRPANSSCGYTLLIYPADMARLDALRTGPMTVAPALIFLVPLFSSILPGLMTKYVQTWLVPIGLVSGIVGALIMGR